MVFVAKFIIPKAFLVFFMFSFAYCFENPPISTIEVAIATNDKVISNIILSVRIQRKGNVWESWKPEIHAADEFRVERRTFDDEIVCVTSGVDLAGLRFLRFGTRNGSFTLVRSDEYFRGYPVYYSFSFKGFPLIGIEIDSTPSKVKPHWKKTSKEIKYEPVVLENGEGKLKKYVLIVDRSSGLSPQNTCFWSDELDFRKWGKITAIEVKERASKEGAYNFAAKYGWENVWTNHGYYLYVHQSQVLYTKERVIPNLRKISAFVYENNGKTFGFIANQEDYEFGTKVTKYRTMSFAGKKCIVAFFEGYTRIIQESLKPWILTKKGQLIQVIPVWMCEIPNKECWRNATGHNVCECAQGFEVVGDLCLKPCGSLIPDKYQDMNILENNTCPTAPLSVCTAESCLKKKVEFMCRNGSWVFNRTNESVKPRGSITTNNCTISCYLDENLQNCFPNENRQRDTSTLITIINDTIRQTMNGVRACYKNNASEACRDSMYKCALTEQKIPLKKVCDRKKDCIDGSDEACPMYVEYKKSKKSNILDDLAAGIGGIFSFFRSLFGGGGGGGGEGGESENENEDNNKKKRRCEWSSWSKLQDECDSTCGSANRKKKTFIRFGNDKCKKRSEKRRKKCGKANDCLTCGDSRCRIDVKFKNFMERDISTNLKKFIRSKKAGGKVTFTTRFSPNDICKCHIVSESYLKCTAKLKGTKTFVVNVKNNAKEKLDLKVNVTIGDYHVVFFKNQVFFDTFLSSRSVFATNLTRDKDKNDKIEFKKVALADKPDEDILVRSNSRPVTWFYFQIDMFFSGSVNYSITVTSGGYSRTSVVTMRIGKGIHCPSCTEGDTSCQRELYYTYYKQDDVAAFQDSNQLESRPQYKRGPPSHKRPGGAPIAGPSSLKKNKIALDLCSRPYNDYFKTWLSSFKIKFRPYPILDSSPYVLGSPANVTYFNTLTLKKIDVKTQKIYKKQIQRIYNDGVKSMKRTTRRFINKLHDLHMIGFATLYKNKPESVSEKLNIQFDHIPPKSALPFDRTTVADPDELKKMLREFSENAPTLAISNFDHRSEVWKNCSTGNTESVEIHKLYQAFMKTRNYSCAIFANIKCIRDVELKLDIDERIFDDANKTAFKRYKEGLKGLVKLHFDYGTNFNYAYKARADAALRPYAALCEYRAPDFTDPKVECISNPKCVKEVYNTRHYYYIKLDGSTKCEKTEKGKNVPLRTQRNMFRTELKLLREYINQISKQAEIDLWNRCCSDGSCDSYLDKPT